MDILKVACIGAGYFAKFHIEAWKRIDGVELIALCDQDLEKAQALAKQFGVGDICSSPDELYENYEFNIIDIITPPDTHLSLCLQAAEHGKHIICQKPLAPTLAEAEKLVSKLKSFDIRFAVHENFRFQPWYRKIKSLLDNEVIGKKIFSINHRMRMGDGWMKEAYLDRQPYFREMPRLLIYETGVHFIDVFRYLVGDIDSVYAQLRTLNQNIKGEDTAVILFNFKNGCIGVLDANRYNESKDKNARYTFGQMLIEGSDGYIRLENDGSIYFRNLGKAELQIAYEHADDNFAGDCVFATQQHIIDCIRSGSKFETNGLDYLENLKVQDAVYHSTETRQRVDI